MASADQIAAIRELQRTAAQSGAPLTFGQARAQAGQQDIGQENIQKLFAEIAQLKAQLNSLKERHDRLRITGQEFSGQGDHIVFNAGAGRQPEGDGFEARTIVVFANGVLATMVVRGTEPVEI